MANAKIYGIAMTKLDVITDVFPQEYRDFVFAGLLDPGDVVEMVMFDLIKMTYDKTEEKHVLQKSTICANFRYYTKVLDSITCCKWSGCILPFIRNCARDQNQFVLLLGGRAESG